MGWGGCGHAQQLGSSAKCDLDLLGRSQKVSDEKVSNAEGMCATEHTACA